MSKLNFFKWFVPACLALTFGPALGQAPPGELGAGEIYTRITTTRVQKYKIIVAPMTFEGLSAAENLEATRHLREVVLADLDFSLRFELVNRRVAELSLAALNSAKGAVDFKSWQATGAEYLVAGSFFQVDKNCVAEVRVYDLSLADLVFLKNYSLDLRNYRREAHRVSDDVVLNVTGERGVATTKIVFVRSTSNTTREVFYCDYDGYNLKQVTHDNSIAKMPSWNSDGTKIAYTTKGPDWDLYLINLADSKENLIYASKGVDMSACWGARNGFLAFSSGVSGNQEIYYLRPGEARPQQLTFSFAMDIEPSWSPNGEEIAFTSTRAGNPHIFVMGADGLNIRRLTFESRNTTPRWRPLPYGDKIVMTSEIRGLFQIAIIDLNGDNFIQLTTDGENREASWSPDGLHMVFSSDRRGGRGNFEIFSMDWDGYSQRPLNQSFSPGQESNWSAYIDW